MIACDLSGVQRVSFSRSVRGSPETAQMDTDYRGTISMIMGLLNIGGS